MKPIFILNEITEYIEDGMLLVFVILYESQVIFFYIRTISIMINSFEVKFKPHGPSNFCKESLEKSESLKMSILQSGNDARGLHEM